jgi:hypothetical protein
MTDSCCCPPEAGNEVCDLPAQNFRRPVHAGNACPECGKTGKPVQGQTVKAMLAVTLRRVEITKYLFCQTKTCPVVYFSLDDKETFGVEEVRERVYQKEPEAQDVFVCYCFRHTVGDLGSASPEERISIVEDVTTGIQAGQCACDLRNPQGSCCLGNLRAMTKRLESPDLVTG